jgi:hypothetical protein
MASLESCRQVWDPIYELPLEKKTVVLYQVLRTMIKEGAKVSPSLVHELIEIFLKKGALRPTLATLEEIFQAQGIDQLPKQTDQELEDEFGVAISAFRANITDLYRVPSH